MTHPNDKTPRTLHCTRSRGIIFVVIRISDRDRIMKRGLRHSIRAQIRDVRVLLQESRYSLILFILILIIGGILFHTAYTYPGTEQHPPFGAALHATFSLIFFETLLPFPEHWGMQALFFIIPIFGLSVVADGVLRIGTALINKQSRTQQWQVAMASTFKNHIIICGMGKVGYRVALELLKFGREVVAVESDADGIFVERARAQGIPVIQADARRTEAILKAGVEQADAIIPCTDDQMTNLDVALGAREINPGIKVVLRMFDADLARRVEKGFGIHTAFSTSALAAPIFATAAMRVNVKHSFYVGDVLLSLSEVAIQPDSQLIGQTVKQLEATLDLSVVCLQCGETTDFHPSPEQALCAGDHLLVLASLEALHKLSQINLEP